MSIIPRNIFPVFSFLQNIILLLSSVKANEVDSPEETPPEGYYVN
jgi:hypothetical protein